MIYNYLPKQLTDKSLADRYLLKDLGTSNSKFPYIKGLTARYSAKGLTNEEMSKNPVWKDLTGNGYDLQMKNFAWGEMSGCNGYSESFSYAFRGSSDSYNTFKSDSEVLIAGARTGIISLNYQKCFFDGYIRVSGLDKIANEITGLTIYLKSQDISDAKYNIKKDGIYKIQIGDINNSSEWVYFWIRPKRSGLFSSPVTIEILPNYPGFIIGDGVDDYAVSEKDLDFEDTYTVYTAFVPFAKESGSNSILCGKLFTKDFDLRYTTTNIAFYSAESVIIGTMSNGFNLFACKRMADKMQFKNLLTGVTREITANALLQNPGLYYLWRNMGAAQYANAAIAGQVICNGHFTTDEEDTKVLNWYKKEYPWLFFNQAWTVTGKSNEDTDRATIANITGNGNNLVLSNFGFAGNSGYGEYAQNFNSFASNNVATYLLSDVSYKSVKITLASSFTGESNPLYWKRGNTYQNKAFNIKISGNDPNIELVMIFSFNNNTSLRIPLKVGINKIPQLTDAQYESLADIPLGVHITTNVTVDDWFTIEQIPDHEGFLVTDGVDDEIVSSVFSMAKDYTVVGEWKLLDNTYVQSGLIKYNSFYIYPRFNMLDFYCKTWNGAARFELKSIAAFNSNGVVYSPEWKEYISDRVGDSDVYDSPLYLGYYRTAFSKVAFKNIAIYVGKILSKEDMIKAYVYLQTLKAK